MVHLEGQAVMPSAPSPTPDEVLRLPLDELAMRLLLTFGSDLNRWNLVNGWGHRLAEHPRRRDVLEAVGEAYDWLAAHGFVAIDPEKSSGGWAYVTKRGRAARAETSATLSRLRAEVRLGVDLHERLARQVERQFVLGEFELAAFAAMREVEIRVRELADAPDSLIGVALMQQAFKPEGGPLCDAAAEGGEQVATMNLFAGALGLFKNPVSHRPVDFDDPTEAAEIVLLADLLLRLLDRTQARLSG